MLRNQSSGKSLFDGIGFGRRSRTGSKSECSDTESRRGSKDRSQKKRSKKHKRDRKEKKSPVSDSVKGMAKAEHFSFI